MGAGSGRRAFFLVGVIVRVGVLAFFVFVLVLVVVDVVDLVDGLVRPHGTGPKMARRSNRRETRGRPIFLGYVQSLVH